ncbi:hypothetical protein [Klebsiella quasipneumoniae]|uniref:hypothetical protein n=1 Tax=Klebsiella quasipneumoniae TaxID=1463165 RepID=UPI00352AECC2
MSLPIKFMRNIESVASQKVANGYAYVRNLNVRARSDMNVAERGWLDGIGAILDIISDSIAIYEASGSLAVSVEGKIKYSIEVKNDSLMFLFVNRIEKPGNFTLVKSGTYLPPGATIIFEFHADSYNGNNAFTISMCGLSIDPNIIHSKDQINNLRIQDTPLINIRFTLNNSSAAMTGLSVNEYTMDVPHNTSNIRALTTYEYLGSVNSFEPSFTVSSIDSLARNVRGEAISNSVLIGPLGDRSSLAPSSQSIGNQGAFSGRNVLHQALKDIYNSNINDESNASGRALISTILTLISFSVSLASAAYQIANVVRNTSKDLLDIAINFSIVNTTDFDVFIHRMGQNNTLNSPLINIGSGKVGSFNLNTINTGAITYIDFTLKSKNSRFAVNCRITLELNIFGFFYVDSVRFGSAATLQNRDLNNHNIVNNFYFRSGSQNNLDRKSITIACSSLANRPGGSIELVLLSN